MLILVFILLFFLGRFTSLLVYQICWANGQSGKFHRAGAFATLLGKWRLWPLHLVILFPLTETSWDGIPVLQNFAILVAILVAGAAVGRTGCAALGKFFGFDRILAIAFAIGVAASPAFLYPCLLASCCLQYTVASWRLSPGYSNLLGFEWMRGSACVLTSCLAVAGWISRFGIDWPEFEAMAVAVILGYQASTYVNHALAKSALGPKWFSWISENRLQCLLVNSWLRGWLLGLHQTSLLRLTRWVGHHRVAICAIVWCLEFSWLLILLDTRFAALVIATTILFHLTVFLLSGLAPFHYLASHAFFLGWIIAADGAKLFPEDVWIACLLAIPIAALGISRLRWKIFQACRNTGSPPHLLRFADAADHLMAWWDSPSMRMFTYTVETKSEKNLHLPVPKLSPHDTSLTDIHTHLMILGLHRDLDPTVEPDSSFARTGVWGLVTDRDDRDRLYNLMDQRGAPPSPSQVEPWELNPDGTSQKSALALRQLFTGMQQGCFRKFSRWPHFPGEDFSPDLCPLAELPSESFQFNEAISSITLWRIKTWFTGNEIQLVDCSKVGVIHLNEPPH